MAGQTSGGEWQSCPVDVSCYIDWLDHWQTLLSGIGAIVAAVVSIHYLRKQINDAAVQETARRKRRLAAHRAGLQLALSDCIHYASDAIQLLKPYLDRVEAGDRDLRDLEDLPRPMLPEPEILTLQAIIEVTDDDAFASLVAEMISQMQVLNSRLRSLGDRESWNVLTLMSYLMNAAKIRGYADSMYEYARRETESPPHALDWDQAISGLNLHHMYAGAYPDLHAFMLRAQERDHTAAGGQAD